MSRFKIIVTICIMVFRLDTAYGQIFLPEDFIGTEYNGEIHLRWEPASIEEWRASKDLGYRVEIYKLTDQSNPIKTKLVRPWSLSEFNRRSDEISDDLFQPYETSMVFTHPAHAGSDEMQVLLNALEKTSDQTVDSFRLSFLSFYSSLDMKLAEANALGVNMGKLPIDQYRVVLKVKGFSTREITVDMRNTKPRYNIAPPKLTAEWGNQVVNFQWNIAGAYRQYYGYVVEKSPKGKPFQRMTALPILDPAVGGEGSNQLELLQFSDSLVANYVETRYRIYQVDYFGHVSKKFSEVSGYGFVEILVSPIITLAEQTKDNHAHIEWTMKESDIPLVKDFSVWRSGAAEGGYEEILADIPKNQREVFIPMEHETNFFRIEVNPIDGKSLSTMPVFVMGMDTIPPATPVAIDATIDTLGQVVIRWHANQEEDLWGYRIFKTNFSNNEYSLINATPTVDTFFIDSVSLINGADSLFYVLQAADNRNNRSDFTEPFALKKPDILPPSAPFIRDLVQRNDSIILEFGRSGSRDVVEYELYRKRINIEKKWTLLKVIDTANINTLYVDTGIEPSTSYAYTLRAIDASGKQSDFANIKILNTPEPEVNFEPFVKIDTKVNAETEEVTISWTMNDEDRFRSILVYRGSDVNKIGKYKFVDAPDMSFTDVMPKEGKIYYKLKPTYIDQQRPYMSEVIEIDVAAVSDNSNNSTMESARPSKKKQKRKRRKKE